MKTAVDANVLLDVLSANPVFGITSKDALADALINGDVVISPIAWSEVGTVFDDVQRYQHLLSEIGIDLEDLNIEALWLAGRIHRSYRERGGSRTRLLGDFLIGAHAMKQCDALLTRDQGFYRDYFSGLQVITP